MAKFSVIFLAMALLVMQEPASASPADVNIYNDISGEDIQVSCFKGSGHGHPLGEKNIPFGHHFGWGFTPSVWGTTKYACQFTWGIRAREFDVWVDDGWISVRPCTHCEWRVGREGFFRIGQYGQRLFIHGWNRD